MKRRGEVLYKAYIISVSVFYDILIQRYVGDHGIELGRGGVLSPPRPNSTPKWVYKCKTCAKKTYIEKESGLFQVFDPKTRNSINLGLWNFERAQLEIFSNTLLDKIEKLSKQQK